jgi:predicted Ser/Thr protein kinase
MICPSCGGELSSSDRFCRACGMPASSFSQAPTAAAPAAAGVAAPVGRLISSDSLPVGGFTPGMVLSERYRVVGLIGRGGMGEVYRADDLKLGQPVALKFLPMALADDPVRRERLFAEVRIARQVSHPNICRVYDIGELEGRHFLTMEYIDGEDLASLLKRIGNLHGPKAVDVAQQLCAGLAAAHDKGVLHRDLKPANVMIDGRGRVRITDFGLAVAAGEETPEADVSGTPPYMAPEQFAGKGASVRSDIYALGLVFYEIFTGKRAFEAKTLAELRAKKETSSPTAPSEIARDIDPIVERVILRCIEKDTRQRPASAAQVAAALPGGDPLAAALAAGETPSPELVAASGGKEGFRPAVAWALLVFIIVGAIAAIAINDRTRLHRRIPFKKSPEVLIERSRDFIVKAGYTEEPADSAYGFDSNSDLLDYIKESVKTSDRWKNLDAKAILFWYRQSQRPIEGPIETGPTRDNPSMQFPGEVVIVRETEGRLLSFRAVPYQAQPAVGVAPSPDWKIFFADAGLDQSEWTPKNAQGFPPPYSDTRVAWKYSLPNRPNTPVGIEAAAYQGKPVSFEIAYPWTPTPQTDPSPTSMRQAIAKALALVLLLVVPTVGGIFFARRNLRLGRGDRRNANRLAVFVIILMMFLVIFYGHHVLTPWEGIALLFWAGISLLAGGLLWVLYIAIEPFVRRRWPQVLISWTRLLSGELRDPVVARDALAGCAWGVSLASIILPLANFAPHWLGYPEPAPELVNYASAGRFYIPVIIALLLVAILQSLGELCLLFLLRVLLRNDKAALVGWVLLMSFVETLFGSSWIYGVLAVVGYALSIFLLMRIGLVAYALALFVVRTLNTNLITLDASAWYASYGYASLAILAVIVLYAFRTSLGDQPLFGRASIED